MQCQDCGYIMDALDTTCKRCARGGAPTATAVAPLPPPPTMPSPTTAPPKPTMRQRPAREPMMEPELGWALTVGLWITMGLQALLLYLLFSSAEEGGGGVGIIGTGVRIVALIAMLRCRRWGFYLFSAFAVFPAVMSLIAGRFDVLGLMIVIVPAVYVFALAVWKWDFFE